MLRETDMARRVRAMLTDKIDSAARRVSIGLPIMSVRFTETATNTKPLSVAAAPAWTARKVSSRAGFRSSRFNVR